MTATDLFGEILGAFAAKQVDLADLPADDSIGAAARASEALFTSGVDTLRSVVPNDRVRALAAVIWDVVGHKRVQVALGPDVPTLAFAISETRGVQQGLIFVPKCWPQMVDADPLMQLGAILFVGCQAVDFCNDRLVGDGGWRGRCGAYEAELLLTLRRTLPSWEPSDYQRQLLAKYSAGLDSAGVVLYTVRPFEPPKEVA